MLDTAIGPVTAVLNDLTFQMNVTHIGKHNQFRYNKYETVFVAANKTGMNILNLRGRRVRCHVRYRDVFNRLFADVELDYT